MTTYKPVRNLIVVETLNEERKTESGIIIPDTVENNNRTEHGRVLAIGPEIEEVIEGDVILFDKYAKTVPLEDDIYILPMDCVLAIKEE